jgi:hypothetical protein
MKIYSDVLSDELLDLCKKDIVQKQKENIWQPSSFFWDYQILRNVDGCCLTTDIIDNTIKDLLTSELSIAFKDYNYSNLIFQYYIWDSYSGISQHDDFQHNFGATIYLNSNILDDGGLFVWQDEECPDNFYRALNPQENMMVVNDNMEIHLVTTVSPHSKQYRYTIQIWGD